MNSIKQIFGNTRLWKLLSTVKINITHTYLKFKWRERKISIGEDHPDTTFYIVRRLHPNVGLFSHYITNIASINYALSKGYIPVVDMMNYQNSYLEEQELYNINAWEYFFEQPTNYSLSQALDSKNVVLGCGHPMENRPTDDMDFFNNVDGQLDFWRRFCRLNVRIQKSVMDKIESEFNEMFLPTDRILGVACRGTDYTTLKFKDHPIQPDVQEVIEKAKQALLEKKCNKIFLSTEDVDIINMFNCAFSKDIVFMNKRSFVNYDGKTFITKQKIKRDRDKYYQGIEYLATIVILSKCNCIIAGRNSGLVGAFLLSEGFEYQYIWDLGRY